MLSGDRDEVAAVLIDVFRSRMSQMDDLIIKECFVVLEKIINKSNNISRFPKFLHSVSHFIFQIYQRYNQGNVCNTLQNQISEIAEI